MTDTTHRRSAAGRIALAIVAGITALVSLAILASGGAVLWADQTQRDDAGYFTSDTHRFSTGAYAITHDGVQVDGVPTAIDVGKLAKIRIRATSADGRPLFVGIARERDLDAYLGGTSRAQLRNFDLDPFRATYDRLGGSRAPAPPASRHIWAASASTSGAGATTLSWPVREGTWSAVVMHADGSRGVAADVRLGADIGYLGWIWGGLFAAGAILLALAILFAILALREVGGGGGAPEAAAGAGSEGAPMPAGGAYPAVLTARLDEPLSRWVWLVKWLLAIPHWIVLTFLWIAFALLTVVAWFAILATGRYPRSIFDFNVGVMRWTWRVSYYGYGALGTDRYPPFSLGREPGYPAFLDVAYPGELSRSLALVKWVLAIPHLLIVGVLAGGGAFWFDHADGWWFGSRASGLIGLLAFVAGVAILFTARYPRGLFDVVVGLNRWVFRVMAYTALMTDEYPPFRLDQGGDEPPAAPATAVTAPS
jgi:hypothetical protein